MPVRLGPGRGSGFTLIEVVVVLVILGVLAGVSAAATAAWSRTEGPSTSSAREAARLQAARTGRPITIWVEKDSGAPAATTYYPDGRAAGEDVHPLTGDRIDE